MRFIHTADWQIGKPFRNFGDQESVLRHARLTAIENIGGLASREGAKHVLIAGDLYDTEAPSQKTLLEPLERMKQFPQVAWHVIPGNHRPTMKRIGAECRIEYRDDLVNGDKYRPLAKVARPNARSHGSMGANDQSDIYELTKFGRYRYPRFVSAPSASR